MKKRIRYIIFIALFFIILLLPVLGMIFDIEPEVKTQKAPVNLSKMPGIPLNARALFEFPERFGAFIRDNHGFRDALIKTDMTINKDVLKTPVVNNILFGKNDFLFWAGDAILENIMTRTPLSQDILKKHARIQKGRKDYLEKRGIKYLFLMPPNKHTIYTEQLPDWLCDAKEMPYFRELAFYLKEKARVDIVDPYGPLNRAKQKYQVYYKSDTHWNNMGGFVGYQEMMMFIHTWFPHVEGLELSDFNVTYEQKEDGDLAIPLGLDGEWADENPVLVPKEAYTYKKMPIDPFYKKNGAGFPVTGLTIYEKEDKNLPKALIFHDSAIELIKPFIANHFRRTVFVYNTFGDNYFDINIIDYEKPDIVIADIGERFLYKIPENPVEIMDNDYMAESFVDFLNTLKKPPEKKWSVFWDTGNGLNENQKKNIIPRLKKENVIRFSLSLPGGLKLLRLDLPPGSQFSMADPVFTVRRLLKKENFRLSSLPILVNQMKRVNDAGFLSNGCDDPLLIWDTTQFDIHSHASKATFEASIYPAFFSVIKDEKKLREIAGVLVLSGRENLSIVLVNMWRTWQKQTGA